MTGFESFFNALFEALQTLVIDGIVGFFADILTQFLPTIGQ